MPLVSQSVTDWVTNVFLVNFTVVIVVSGRRLLLWRTGVYLTINAHWWLVVRDIPIGLAVAIIHDSHHGEAVAVAFRVHQNRVGRAWHGRILHRLVVLVMIMIKVLPIRVWIHMMSLLLVWVWELGQLIVVIGDAEASTRIITLLWLTLLRHEVVSRVVVGRRQ